MQLHFNSISELTRPGEKWKKLFNTYWPAYAAWINAKGASHTPDLKTSIAALKYYMPEMLPTYERLCKLVDADEVAARFLTGFQPPAYISACSQAVQVEDKIQLIRNYDYHPDLTEGTLLMSAWNGKKVIANNDCLIGVLDGMNENGLVISLTFGGRNVVGKGFGIPFILRYVLEFCSDVEEAVEALVRIPSHMSYNVTVVDKSAAFKTVHLAPDRAPIVTDAPFTTNHQKTVEWPENAQFNKTVERLVFLENKFTQNVSADNLVGAFLQPPFYNTRFNEGFGTLYTVVYRPVDGTVQMHWPSDNMTQTFAGFREEYKLIKFFQSIIPATISEMPADLTKQNLSDSPSSSECPEAVNDSFVTTLTQVDAEKDKVRLKTLREQIIHRGQISWKIFADYWASIGKGHWRNWNK